MSEYTMTNDEMIKALISNYPPSEYTMLTEAIDKSIDLLEEDKVGTLKYQSILKLKDDIKYVQEGAQYSEPIIMRESYPSNPDIGEYSSVYTFVDATLKLTKELLLIIEEVEDDV